MHQVLGIKKMYGLDFQGFFDLLQRVAEEHALMTLQDVTLDDVVPLAVVEVFAQDFIQGFMKLMVFVTLRQGQWTVTFFSPFLN